jgi:hypothetical protein
MAIFLRYVDLEAAQSTNMRDHLRVAGGATSSGAPMKE